MDLVTDQIHLTGISIYCRSEEVLQAHLDIIRNDGYTLIVNYPIFTEVIVSDPPTALSLKKATLSFVPFNPNEYINGR